MAANPWYVTTSTAWSGVAFEVAADAVGELLGSLVREREPDDAVGIEPVSRRRGWRHGRRRSPSCRFPPRRSPGAIRAGAPTMTAACSGDGRKAPDGHDTKPLSPNGPGRADARSTRHHRHALAKRRPPALGADVGGDLLEPGADVGEVLGSERAPSARRRGRRVGTTPPPRRRLRRGRGPLGRRGGSSRAGGRMAASVRRRHLAPRLVVDDSQRPRVVRLDAVGPSPSSRPAELKGKRTLKGDGVLGVLRPQLVEVGEETRPSVFQTASNGEKRSGSHAASSSASADGEIAGGDRRRGRRPRRVRARRG